jgi:hypothetical protein
MRRHKSNTMRRLARQLKHHDDPNEFMATMNHLFGDDAATVTAKLARESTSPELRNLATVAGAMMGGLPEGADDDEGGLRRSWEPVHGWRVSPNDSDDDSATAP